MREWFSQPENMILALAVALLLVGIGRLPRLFAWLGRLRLVLAGSVAQAGFAVPFTQFLGWTRPTIPSPLATVPHGGDALSQPLGLEQSLAYMRNSSPNDRYLLPLGWRRNRAGAADLAHTTLVGETNHLLISGASDCGKDNLAWWMLLSLALVHRDPQQLQVAIIDGKGLDFQPWAGKAHTWLLATESEQIPAAMRALTAERQRRRRILEQAGVSKWEQYRGGDLPLLVVFISELSLLETALRQERQRRDRERTQDLDLEAWLNDELTSGRAFGIRYLIGMQTVTGMDMLWRSQIGVFLAGYQPDETQVKPNTSKTAKQIAAAGAVPPHLLPAPPAGAGVFTVVSGHQCVTMRSPYLTDTERRRWLGYLPARPIANEENVSRLLADPGTAAMPEQAPRVMDCAGGEGGKTGERFAGAENAFLAAESGFSFSHLQFSPVDIAEIGARIARGETKTEVVRKMPGYATRRHREFAAYYDMLYTRLRKQYPAIASTVCDKPLAGDAEHFDLQRLPVASADTGKKVVNAKEVQQIRS